ncbi:MAG: hypothetical protein MJ153_06355 [Clostridia bacterium]|nr:hypothetical protein [Clostridia bacterium]
MSKLSKKTKIVFDIVLIILFMVMCLFSFEFVERDTKVKYTQVVTSANGEITEPIKSNLVVKHSGDVSLHAAWWPEEDLGFLTLFTVNDSDGNTVFYSSGNKLTCESLPLQLDEGSYEVKFTFFNNIDDINAALANLGTAIDKDENTFDGFCDGEWAVDFSFGYVQKNIGAYVSAALFALVTVFVAIHLFVLCTSSDGKLQFDERQLLARGRASTASMITMFIYFGVYLFAKLCEIDLYLHDVVYIFAGIIAGSFVFAIISICKDAYVALNQRRTALCICLAVLAVLNGVMCVYNYKLFVKYNYSVDSLVFGVAIINLISTVVLLGALVVMIGKAVYDKRET